MGIACGAMLVRFLTIHPLRIGLYASLAAVSLVGLLVTLVEFFSGWERAAAAILGLACAALGYGLTTRAVLAQEEERVVPELTRREGDPGLGHTAVVYFTHGEPETYNPMGWLNQFREFDQQKIAFVPFLVRPLFLYKLRAAYLKVGASRHRQGHQRMVRRVEESLRAGGYPDLRCYLSFLDDEPRPDAALIQALNEGASRIVVAEVFVSISNHTAEGEEQVRAVGADGLAPLRFTGPLWDSPTLQRMFVEKANAARGNCDRAEVGVILVGHGQPDEWDREFPEETAHEIEFRQHILELLVADGYKRENVGLAWMEFKLPRPAQKVEALVGKGVRKILYFSAAISADSIHSQYDVPELIAKAKIPAGVELVNLGAWNDHPLAIAAIHEKIAAELEKF
jgi:protoheme ferro-lyase